MSEQNVSEYSVASGDAMMTFGERLARCSPAPLTVYLYGELGAGKTTLVRGFLGGLQFTGAVKSPTYTLVEPYPTEPPVYHFDLYRLGDPEELEFLGIRDYFEGDTVRLIEWPERGAGVLPAPDVEILIEYAGTGRHLTLRAYTEAARRLITCLNYQ